VLKCLRISTHMYGIEIVEVKYYTANRETGDTIDEVDTVEDGIIKPEREKVRNNEESVSSRTLWRPV